MNIMRNNARLVCIRSRPRYRHSCLGHCGNVTVTRTGFSGCWASQVPSTITSLLAATVIYVIINYKFIKLQPFIRFVDVLATTAAFNKSNKRL